MKRSTLTAILFAALACNDSTPDRIRLDGHHRSSPKLVSFASCDALLAELRGNIAEEMRVNLERQREMYDEYYYGGMMEDEAGAPMADSATGGDASGEGRTEGVDFSGTNNQESGVDEADLVKTDGYSIFVLNGNRLEIFAVPEFGELEHTSSTALEGWPTQLLIGSDKAAVFSSIYAWHLPEGHPLREVLAHQVDGHGNVWYRTSSLSKITLLDVSNPAAPTLLRELYLEGYYQTARRVGSTTRMVAYSWFDVAGLVSWLELPASFWELDATDPLRDVLLDHALNVSIAHNDAVLAETPLEDFLPAMYIVDATGALTTHQFTDEACSTFATAEDGLSRGFTSILSVDLLNDALTIDADHIVSTWSTVYASTDTLVIAEPAQDWWWYWNNEEFDEATNIHRFDISQPGLTTYSGSGRIDGTVLGQFALSELDGRIRVAATTGSWNRWWEDDPEEEENHVYVLEGDDELTQVGHVGGIGMGERIWSSRFVGDKAFLVTFRQIDPLWTIDLSEPTAPRVVGELEVPGVSTYIHPLADDQLLTIGYGGDADGLDWSTTVSLFDVTDFAHPAIDDAMSLAPPPGDGWSYAFSEATWEHKAFQYWGPLDMLAVPVSTYRYVNTPCAYDGDAEAYYCGTYEYVSKLELIGVGADSGLTSHGAIDHSDFFNSDAHAWWDYRDIRRSIFMGDYVYAISDRGVTAHRISDLTLSASHELPGSVDGAYWYW